MGQERISEMFKHLFRVEHISTTSVGDHLRHCGDDVGDERPEYGEVSVQVKTASSACHQHSGGRSGKPCRWCGQRK